MINFIFTSQSCVRTVSYTKQLTVLFLDNSPKGRLPVPSAHSFTSTNRQMSRLVGKPTMWFPNRSDTNRLIQSQKRARSLKFWIYKVEELYYPCSENKGADQLRGYREADLRLCFRICILLVFPWGGSNALLNQKRQNVGWKIRSDFSDLFLQTIR